MTVSKFFYEGFYYPPQQGIRYDHSQKISAASLNWTELGITYSTIINRGIKNVWSAGINLKYLMGIAGAYMHSDHFNFIVPGTDTLTVFDADVEAGMSLPINYRDNSKLLNPIFKGRGISFDVGISFEQKKSSPVNAGKFKRICSQPYIDYSYRLGFSLLDIGEINFASNALKMQVSNGEMFWPGVTDVRLPTTIDVVNNISFRFFGDTSTLITGNKITMFLPAALSIQSDANLNKNWYLSSTLIVPIRVSKFEVVRSSLLAAGIRYETLHLSLGTNLSIFNLEKVHIGLFGRFHGFFIGTDNLFSFLDVYDFTGMDIYAGIKVSLRKGHCSSSPVSDCVYDEVKKFQKYKKKQFNFGK